MRFHVCLAIILIVVAACSSTETPPPAAVTIGAPSPMPTNTNAPTQRVTSAPDTPLPRPPSGTATSASLPAPGLAVVDQSSVFDASRGGWWSIQALGPVGQTFSPSFAGLDAVELWTEDQADPECSGAGAELQVNIREVTMDGPLVGSSTIVALPDCFKGITHFDFPSLVPVAPDRPYVIDVVVVSGANWGVKWQQIPNPYSRGDSIVLGQPAGAGLWFRVGLRHSSPLTEAYCENGLWQHLSRAGGGAFKNQGDCIQYANTR